MKTYLVEFKFLMTIDARDELDVAEKAGEFIEKLKEESANKDFALDYIFDRMTCEMKYPKN